MTILLLTYFWGEKVVRVARLGIAEWKSEREMQQFVDDYSKAFWNYFPDAEGATLIKTGPTSGINTTIYPNEDIANASMEPRTKFMASHMDGISDTFFYEGEVIFSTSRTKEAEKPQKMKQKTLPELLVEQKKEIAELKAMLSEVLARPAV